MFHSGPKVRTGFEKEEVRRFRFEPPDLADLGIKALVPRKNGELERRSLSKICEGAREAAGPPAPQEQQGVWRAAAPQ